MNPIEGRPLLLVSSCGTSILTNVLEQDERSHLRALANLSASEMDADAKQLLETLAGRVRSHILPGASSDVVRRASAELNAIEELIATRRPQRGHHLLIHSDTAVGALAAGLLADILRDRHPHLAVDLVRVPDLSTSSVEGFRSGLSWLARWAEESLPGWRASHGVVFNLTGGFKSVNGFLQVLATFYGDELVYVFESEDAPLLTIPRLPVRMDAEDLVSSHGSVLRRMAVLGPVPAVEADGVPETLVLTLDGESVLSEWGELVWGRARSDAYGRHLQDPLVASLRYSRRFTSVASRLTPDRLRILNRRLDDLAAYLDGGRVDCPASLSFKPLAGSPVPGSTHEFYAWSDQNAARCFAHFERDGDREVLVVDTLGDHL